MNNFVITIRRPYTKRIIKRTKRFEIRTRIPKDLEKGSKIYVVEAGTHGEIFFSFIVGSIINIDPWDAWLQYGHEDLGVSLDDYYEYTKESKSIYLIEITNIESFPGGFNLRDMSIKHPPMWFARVK